MDKETLSNYGWIVIAVLVLAVMIALATPFGSFVSEAVQSTTKGLFDVNKSALDSTGLINIDNQEFDVPDMNHGAGDNNGAGQTPVTPATYQIIEGAGQTVTTTGASFRSSADYDKFDSVKVDNNVVDPSNYTVSEGSTIILFDGEYLATLSNGTHTLEIISTDGSALCEFTINIASEPEENVYELSGSWQWNSYSIIEPGTPESPTFSGIEQDIVEQVNFTTTLGEFDTFIAQFVSETDTTPISIGGKNTNSASPLIPVLHLDTLDSEEGSYINFGSTPQAVSKEFYEWFTANATQQ